MPVPFSGPGILVIIEMDCEFFTGCQAPNGEGSAKEMSIPVKINVRTTINNEETFELVVFGQYYLKNGARFLQYDETTEEGTIHTIVKTAPDEALILRSGAVKMRLPFQLHKTLNGSYEMPFGRFETTTLTKQLAQDENAFDILYDFTLQGSPAGTYHLEITFQED
jgi:uncharacterized beta-barrel protein YwiB (DUF1934 family)